jgi:high-affinity nickel permease
MLGLDEQITRLASGEPLLVIVAIAILLGLRHATDPDHLTAVTTLIAVQDDRRPRKAAVLGMWWGLGHATTLTLCGLPIVLYRKFLPEPVVRSAEVLIGVVIIALAVRLIVRWRAGAFHAHRHDHDGISHRHLHSHAGRADHADHHAALSLGRSPVQAYAIGLVHGVGGSAGVGVLLLAGIGDDVTAVVALVTFASFTMVSMVIASTGLGYAITRRRARDRLTRLAPALGVTSILFGLWYTLGALNAAPYLF